MLKGASMKILKACLAILVVLLTACNAIATELPPPPEGYSWVHCDEIKGAFLMPIGWHFKKHKQGDKLGYFITEENIATKGEFLTGLSVNVIPEISQKNGMPPSIYANTYIKTAIIEKEIFKKPWATTMGPFQAYGVVLLNRDHHKGDFITHNLAIANDQTGTLYLLIFESPAKSWEASWAVAKPMLQRFLIDDSI